MKNIQLKKIKLENFFGLAQAEYEFEKGVNTIVAESESGKTTFSNAVYFVFGLDVKGYQPITSNKVLIPNLETNVQLTIIVDGNEYTLARKSIQKWTTDKETGVDIYKGAESNMYNFDGQPMNSTQFNNELCNLLSIRKELLPIIAIPDYFNNCIDYKARRKILYELCNVDFLTKDLAKKECYNLIASDLNKNKKTEDIAKIIATEKTSLGRERTEIDTMMKVRSIDLAEIAKIDFLALDKEFDKVEKEIDVLLANSNKSNKNEIISKKLSEIQATQLKANQLERKNIADKQAYLDSKNSAYQKALQVASDIKNLDYQVQTTQGKIDDIDNQIIDIKNEKPSTETICSKCEQELPQEQIDTRVLSFENRQTSRINKLKQDRVEEITKLTSLQSNLTACNADYSGLKKTYEELKANEFTAATSRIKALNATVTILDKEISTLKMAEVKSETNKRLEELKLKRSEFEHLRGKKADIDKITAQIKTISERSDNLSDREIVNIKKRKQLDNYIMESISLVNDIINSYFDSRIKFRLFNKLTSGADKDFSEDCEVEYKGVSYENSLSGGQRIFADYLINLGLKNILGIDMFMFIDEIQSCTLDFNANNIQTIFLETKKGKKLDPTKCVKVEIAYKTIIDKLNSKTEETQNV